MRTTRFRRATTRRPENADSRKRRAATLEEDYGRYSFRRWHAAFDARPGRTTLAVRATANDGSAQPVTPGWNPGGYLRNSIETYTVTVA